MPRLNSAGKPSLGYLTTWYDEERTIVTNTSNGDLRVTLSDGTELAGPLQTSVRYAGSSKWTAEVPTGVMWAGSVITGAALGPYCDPIGPDGSLLVKRVRNSEGPWGFVGGADFGGIGKVGEPRTVTNYGGGRASWIDGNWTFHANFPTKWEGTKCENYRLKGDDFLCQSYPNGELTLNNKVIGGGGSYFRPDFNRVGDTFFIVWSPVEGEPVNVAKTITLGELAGLPAPDSPGPVVVTPPPPPNGGHPMPSQDPIPNNFPIVEAIRAKYPTPLGTSHAGFLLEVASATKMGLLRKNGGTVVTLPDGVTVAQDILMDPKSGRIFDILEDGENTAKPSWGEANGSPADMGRLYQVSQGPVPVPEPTPKPEPPPIDITAALREALTPILNQLSDLRSIATNLGNAVEIIERDLSTVEDDLNKIKARLAQKISTSRKFGHSHEVVI